MSVVLVFQYPYCVEPGSESRSALVQRNGSEPKIYSFHIAEYCYTLKVEVMFFQSTCMNIIFELMAICHRICKFRPISCTHMLQNQ